MGGFLTLTQLIIERMQQPAVLTSHLRGDSELIILFRRRLPFFSMTLPIEIRPRTGGVIARPLSMVVLLHTKRPATQR